MSGDGAEGSPAPHLDWAAYIKSQHHHLQCTLQSVPALDSAVDTLCTAGAPTNPTSSSTIFANSEDDELRRWQAMLSTPEEHNRLQAYAVAMHHLATQYWEGPPTSFGRQQPEGPVGEESDAAPTQGGTARKRSRSPVLGDGDSCPHRFPEVPAEALQRRRYNDRVQYSLDCLQTYYLGEARRPLPPSTSRLNRVSQDGLYVTLPLIFSTAVKPLRREFFAAHARQADPLEIEAILNLRPPPDGGPSLPCFPVSEAARQGPDTAWATALLYDRLQRQPSKESVRAGVPPLCVLDVGSCYGPFFGKAVPHAALGAVPVMVDAVDLQPYRDPTPRDMLSDSEGAYVWKGDWISVNFFEAAQLPEAVGEENASLRAVAGGRLIVRDVKLTSSDHVQGEALGTSPGRQPSAPTLIAVQLASYDAVFFCLLLSYLPSPRLRYRACLHSFLSLKEGGLLVIVSTRTQGSRKGRWMQEWVACLGAMGLQRVHQQVREKLIVLSFAKNTRPEDAEELRLHGVRTWIESKLQTPAASTGLRIMADM